MRLMGGYVCMKEKTEVRGRKDAEGVLRARNAFRLGADQWR